MFGRCWLVLGQWLRRRSISMEGWPGVWSRWRNTACPSTFGQLLEPPPLVWYCFWHQGFAEANFMSQNVTFDIDDLESGRETRGSYYGICQGPKFWMTNTLRFLLQGFSSFACSFVQPLRRRHPWLAASRTSTERHGHNLSPAWHWLRRGCHYWSALRSLLKAHGCLVGFSMGFSMICPLIDAIKMEVEHVWTSDGATDTNRFTLWVAERVRSVIFAYWFWGWLSCSMALALESYKHSWWFIRCRPGSTEQFNYVQSPSDSSGILGFRSPMCSHDCFPWGGWTLSSGSARCRDGSQLQRAWLRLFETKYSLTFSGQRTTDYRLERKW